ncbi:hypothetical protein QTP86_002606 [Hemibagrus guttatus]|nr:hypothetical protein QTP86_002606 [Hemibagrus guttatus]
MDLICPLSTIRMKNSSPAPWLSDVLRNNRRELRSAARKWKKSKLDTDLISYRTLLSKFSLDVTSAKTSFYKEKLETSAQDPQKLHNIFSSLLNPPAPPSPSSLTAEDFATFYTEKIEGICQTFTSLPTSPTSHSQHSATPSLTQLSTVASEEVLQITRSCNPTTCPLDPIPSAMLQTISPDLLPFITTVINGSLMSGHVPTAFKKARVIPILKKPALDPSDISNYRPNNLHDPKQSGFKAAHSTETALLAVTEKLHAARSAKLSSVLILLDLSAAFDTVDHKTLLSTLRSLGICGTAWEWFASYLDGRSYQVTWKGLTSAPRGLSTGVPYHGFCSDLSVSGGHFILDDCSSAETQPQKTELLIIPGDPSPAQDLAISLSNSIISPTASARNLGVTMDNQLSFSSHVTNVTRSCRFLLYNIRRIRPFLTTQATQVLVQSLVISRLDYCNSLLACLPLNAIRPLQMIQNAAARLVFNLPKFSHNTPLLRSLHWLPVAARIRFKTLMLTYKAKNGPAPSYLKALVTSRTAPRLLRSTSAARLVPPSLREKGYLYQKFQHHCHDRACFPNYLVVSVGIGCLHPVIPVNYSIEDDVCYHLRTLGNGDEDDRGPWEQDSLGGTDGIPRVARGQGCHPDPPKTSLQDHTPPSQPDIGDGCRVAWSSRLPGSGRLCRQYRSRVEEVPQVLRTEEEEQNQ